MAMAQFRPTLKRGLALSLALGLFASAAGAAQAAPADPTSDPSLSDDAMSPLPSASPSVSPETAELEELDPTGDPAIPVEVQSEPEDETPVDSPFVDLWGPGIDAEAAEGATIDGPQPQILMAPQADVGTQADTSNDSPAATGVTVAPRLPTDKVAGIYLNDQWSSQANIGFSFGSSTDSFLTGDWDGDGTDTLAIHSGATFYVTNRHGDGALDRVFVYGHPGDTVLVGDWDGDGKDTFAVRRGNVFHVQNTLAGGTASSTVAYGAPGDTILVGDWDGDGRDTFAVRRANHYHIRNSMTSGKADHVISYGKAADAVVVGDWDGNGTDTLTVRRGNAYHTRNTLTSGVADKVVNYGTTSDEVLAGDWNKDGKDTLGVVRRDGVVPPVQAAHDPFGTLDSLTPNADGTVTAVGWAVDPGVAKAPVVQIHVDSVPQLIRPSLKRADVKKAFNLGFDTVGFQKTLTMSPGSHRICVSVINEGSGSNKSLRCETVTAKVTSNPTTPPTPPTPNPTDPSTTFTPGNIISDAVMFDENTMTAAQIQTFLNTRNPNCTPGSAACLKDYRATTSTMQAPYCDTYLGAPNESAATMIHKSAKACGINPQVLLVKLQKEQALVTASGAGLTETRYKKALGYGCPDNAGCNASYAGLAQQLYYASSGLIRYGEEPQRYNFRAGQTANIQYNPIASCGSSPVLISNRATAALYNYTPYQPNAAALANMTGEGDSCSTYGNRNFWRIFNSWFGSTH